VIFVVVVSAAAGLYTYTTVKTATSTSNSALTVERVLACETPSCIESAVADTPDDKLISLYETISEQSKAIALQPTGLQQVGGTCIIAGNAIGARVADRSTLEEFPDLINSIEFNRKMAANETNAYPCPYGFANGLAKTFATSASISTAADVIAKLCPELNGDDPSARPAYTPQATTCLRAAGSFAAVTALQNEGDWSDVVKACNSKHPVHTAACLEGSLFRLLNDNSTLPMEYAMCSDAKLQLYCEMLVARSKTFGDYLNIDVAEDIFSSIREICLDASDTKVCRQGFYTGVVLTPQSLDECIRFGQFASECSEVVLVRGVLNYMRLSNLRGEVIKSGFCSRIPTYRETCDKIAENILDYDFKSGLL
jgi:hypothetical protein